MPASPPIAPAISSRTSTRPISKTMARRFLGSRVLGAGLLGSNGLCFFGYRRLYCCVAALCVAIHRASTLGVATLCFAAFAKNADHCGKQRNHHYDGDYIMDFLTNIGNRTA